MLDFDQNELDVLAAIRLNHQKMLNEQMVTHFSVYFDQAEHPERLFSWMESIDEVRLISNHYLDSVAHSSSSSIDDTIKKETSTAAYIKNIIKSIIPARLSESIFDPNYFSAKSPFSSDLVSVNLNRSITELFFDYFRKSFFGTEDEAQKQFAELINSHKELTHIVTQECERLSVEIIKLFHFREMLLLGKISLNPLEPNARKALISRTQVQQLSSKSINLAIEVYYARELSRIFNEAFKSLYQVQQADINAELKSPFIKWFNQLMESHEKRLSFTQEIQLKFMQLSSEFLLSQMNEVGFLARHPKAYASIAGIIAGTVAAGALAIIFGGPFIWGVLAVAMVGFILGSISSYFLITKVDALAYKRSKVNREEIQHTINMVNNEFLRLQKEVVDRKETTSDDIAHTKDFQKINQHIKALLEGNKVARGSIGGWLREFASRYRHSKAVEIDLGDEYKLLMRQSKTQTRQLIDSINQEHLHLLQKWIKGTQAYLKNPKHAAIIKDFELTQKIKEQVLEIISKIKSPPPMLSQFYVKPTSEGGLGGNEADFSHYLRLVPSLKTKTDNPYQYLCDTALDLFKKYEPKYMKLPVFYGDAQYRQMLGIPREDQALPNSENINEYLDNSYHFLLSLCPKINPGPNLDPLDQNAQVSDAFILYRMLLLKQLAVLCSSESKNINSEAKRSIRRFVQQHFQVDPDVIFDDLINQMFLLNKETQTSVKFTNRDGFTVNAVELNNIVQAVGLDIAYNSVSFKWKDILKNYIDEFVHYRENNPVFLFAYQVKEQELNPQSTSQFVELISRYCEDTADFISRYQKNKTLSEINILECYKYNVSIQAYRELIRIAKNIKDSTGPINHLFHQQPDHLIQAFMRLYGFCKKYCMPLDKKSDIYELFEFISTRNNTPVKEWIKNLKPSSELMQLMDTLPEQFSASSGKTGVTPVFFNTKIAGKSEQLVASLNI